MFKLLKIKHKHRNLLTNKITSKQISLIAFFVIFVCVIILIQFFYDDQRKVFYTISELKRLETWEKDLQFWIPLGFMLAGFGLPIVGGTMQIINRNKLSGPTTLGYFPVILTAIMISTFIMGDAIWIKYILAFSFSLIILVINFIFTKSNAIINNFKIVLVGFAISAIFTGVNWILHKYGQINIEPISWLTGGSDSTPNEKKLIISGTVILVCTTILFCLSPILNIISKDFLLAKSLGINVDLIYWVVAMLGIFITVSSVLVAGGVVLLGLITPHLVRIIFKTSNNIIILPISGILGMFLLVISNWLTRSILPSVNINLLTAIIAIPVFVAILRKNKNE